MANWNLNIRGKGVRKASVEKLALTLKEEFGEGVSISVTDSTPPESRAERFEAAKNLVSDAKSDMESLKEELESWLENLPDQFRDGDKGEQLQTAIDALDEVINRLEEAEQAEVEFPGMMS